MKKQVNVVGAVIRNPNHEVLCALRSPRMSSPNLWEFPGGKIELNEHPKQALIREIQEELNCLIEVGELIEETAHPQSDVIVKLSTYHAKIIQGTPVAKEHSKLVWLPIELLPTIEWAPADLPTVRKLNAAVQSNANPESG